MYGLRKESFLSGADFMSFDLMHPVFGLSQAVWDVRSLVSWLKKEEGASRLRLYGISLGAYASSLSSSADVLVSEALVDSEFLARRAELAAV